MISEIQLPSGDSRYRSDRNPLWSPLATMSLSTLVVSAAIIVFFEGTGAEGPWARVSGIMSVAAVTLMPYMISAAVAATTAVGIMLIWPWIRIPSALSAVQARLREMAVGDLASRIRISGDNEMVSGLAREINATVGELGNLIARWKLLDRGQWDLLESIRLAATKGDTETIARQVKLLQENFEKIGELHQQIVT
ncbi:MAG: hypothetical protein ABIE70_05495 [bacterium]